MLAIFSFGFSFAATSSTVGSRSTRIKHRRPAEVRRVKPTLTWRSRPRSDHDALDALACRNWLPDCYTSGMFDRITFDPMVMGGRACIRGMRITVALIVNLVANGMSPENIIREYPELDGEDIRESLQYASALANEEIGFFKSPAA